MIPPTSFSTIPPYGCGRAAARPTLSDTVDRMSRLLKGRGIASHRLDARLITAFVLGLTESDCYLRPDRPLTEGEVTEIVSLVERRAAGVPAASIIGRKEFWSLTVSVNEHVLIPRPETEILVEETIAAAREFAGDDLRIVEIGTGSGAVALALRMELPGAHIVSTDISAEALSTAAANFATHGVSDLIETRRGDLYGALKPYEAFDIIVMNPPYLTERELDEGPQEIKGEPRIALFGGRDGLEVIRRLVAGAPGHLAPNGYLIVEIGARQGGAVRRIMVETPGLFFSHTARDLAGHARTAVARRSP